MDIYGRRKKNHKKQGSKDREFETRASKPRWSGLSLEIGDVTPVWDDGKRVKAH